MKRKQDGVTILRRRQAGVTMVLVALLLTSLCGAAALAVDIGMLFSAKSAAQNAADAAALAGAFTFLTPADAQPTAAQNAAISVAAANSVLGQAVAITASDVTVSQPDVTVTVPITAPAFFSAVLGFLNFNLSATATAEASPFATGSGNVKPMFVPNHILGPTTPLLIAGLPCSPSPCSPLPWSANQSALALSGTQEILRPTHPGDAPAPSQFFSLDFGDGGSGYSCVLGKPLASCNLPPLMGCTVPDPNNPPNYATESIATENGNMVGPTTQGIDTLTAPGDKWVGPGAYLHADGSTTDTSTQLVVVPIWDDSIPLKSGKDTISVIGFSTWFISGIDPTTGNVTGHFVNFAPCGTGAAGVATNSSFGIPVHLVTPN